MPPSNIEIVIGDLQSALRQVQIENEGNFRLIERGFKSAKDIPAGALPAIMLGISSATTTEEQDSAEILLVILARRNSKTTCDAVIELLRSGWGSNATISELDFGELFPGRTEGAESLALPDGAFLASWLDVERPIEGFWARVSFTIAPI